ANMDSLKASRQTYGTKNELNLEDQLFKYGVRLNSNLVLDLNARSIPIVTGMMGNQPQQELLPWLYFPILTPQTNHPIVRNLNSIMTEFASTIDTVEVPNIKKTVLLQSSIYTRLLNSPAIIDLALLEQQPNASDYQTPPQAISVLLEGEFTSLYANRIPPKLKENYTLPPKKDKSITTSMVVCSDGDLIKNQIHYTQNYPLPLGYDQFTGQNFGNKDFIVNTMSYLTETNNLISIRSRELKLRLLDKNKVGESAFAIQTINTLLPLLLIAFMGFVFAFLRKRKYTVK
ncbi:MAG: hypothetical protein JW729_11210, partial [Bacteroidales bacterium]|nr:hypothetical protein [Bacteroidales bacterium]